MVDSDGDSEPGGDFMTNKPASAICGCQNHRATPDATPCASSPPLPGDINNVKGGLLALPVKCLS